MTQQEIQELKTQVRKASTLGKAHVIAVSRRIHKSSQGNMWMVESSSNGFYVVEYVGEEMICSCPAFVYGMTVPCKHILCLGLLKDLMKLS